MSFLLNLATRNFKIAEKLYNKNTFSFSILIIDVFLAESSEILLQSKS